MFNNLQYSLDIIDPQGLIINESKSSETVPFKDEIIMKNVNSIFTCNKGAVILLPDGWGTREFGIGC